jgi:hypothetical protein
LIFIRIDNIDKSLEFTKGKRLKLVAFTLIKFVLKLYPMQS